MPLLVVCLLLSYAAPLVLLALHRRKQHKALRERPESAVEQSDDAGQ